LEWNQELKSTLSSYARSSRVDTKIQHKLLVKVNLL